MRRAAANGSTLAMTIVAGTLFALPTFADPWPGTSWPTATPAQMGMNATVLAQARDYALTGGGAGMIIRFGRVVDSWGDPAQRWELKSTTKSIGALLVGVGIREGRVALDDSAQQHYAGIGVPPDENATTGWLDGLTIRNLLRHSSGFDQPGGFSPLVCAPDSAWLYSDCGVDWLADVMTVAFGDDLWTILDNRVLDPIGVHDSDFVWRSNEYRPPTLNGFARREFGSGIDASVDALARLGYLCLRGESGTGRRSSIRRSWPAWGRRIRGSRRCRIWTRRSSPERRRTTDTCGGRTRTVRSRMCRRTRSSVGDSSTAFCSSSRAWTSSPCARAMDGVQAGTRTTRSCSRSPDRSPLRWIPHRPSHRCRGVDCTAHIVETDRAAGDDRCGPRRSATSRDERSDQ